MNKQEYLKKYIEICNLNIKENKRILSMLKNQGIFEAYIFDNFCIGYSSGGILDIIGDNQELLSYFNEVGIIKNNKEEINPSKILQPAMDAMEKIVEARLKLFNNLK